MNNQAAQTVPWIQERELIRAALCKELDTNIESDERTYTIAVRAANALHWRQIEIDQLKAQVAALSQTAGVPGGWRKVVMAELTRWMCARDAETAYARLTEALAAAPAASGGEDDPYAFSESRREHEAACRDRMNVSGVFKAEPPAGASVSERARAIEMLAQEVDKDMTACADDIRAGKLHGMADASVRAIIRAMGEQALTQQRGSVAWTHDAETWGNSLNEAAWVFIEQCPEKSTLLFNHTKGPLRSAILKYAELVGATTPQPGAEALRTVIASMSNFADVADQCELTEHNAQVAIRSWVTQLESLLARGGK